MYPELIQKALVAQFLTELFERRSDEPLQHLITSRFRWHAAGEPAGEEGVAAVQPLLARLRERYSVTRLVVEDLFADGDRVAARYRLEGDEAAGSRGRRTSTAGMLVARVERGRVAEAWHQGAALELPIPVPAASRPAA